MRHANFYNKCFFCFVLLFSFLGLQAQLECTVRLLDDGETFGVFVRPSEGLMPSRYTVTGTGQMTLVVPTGFQMSNFESVSGGWEANARINAPAENPLKDYICVGFTHDVPSIVFKEGTETLLFSFRVESELIEAVYLIDNETDPFAELPNSLKVNPGNDFTVCDVGKDKAIYTFSHVYESETLPFAKKD